MDSRSALHYFESLLELDSFMFISRDMLLPDRNALGGGKNGEHQHYCAQSSLGVSPSAARPRCEGQQRLLQGL